jgi:phage baseplate assembly protein W
MDINKVKSSIWSISLQKQGDLVEGIEHINQCLVILLTTRKGADPLRPEFGCGIIQKLDRPIQQVKSLLANEIKTAIDMFITDITVVKIEPIVTIGSITVNIQWAFKEITDTKQVANTYGVVVDYKTSN